MPDFEGRQAPEAPLETAGESDPGAAGKRKRRAALRRAAEAVQGVATRHAPATARTGPEDEPPPPFNAGMSRTQKAEVADPLPAAAVAAPPGVCTLCIDVGGTGLKALIIDDRCRPQGPRIRVATPRPATPNAVLAAVRAMVEPLGGYDRISVGFPGVVTQGITRTAPNLDGDWTHFHLAEKLSAMTGKPARVLNDAGVQGFGVIEGKGVEMVLTLGTGMGCALFVDGRYVPNLELSHHPFKGRKTYEDYVSAQAREKLGNKKWNKHVARVIAQIVPIFNPDRIYLGGGNSKHLRIDLPPHVKVTPNEAGLLGGLALWKD